MACHFKLGPVHFQNQQASGLSQIILQHWITHGMDSMAQNGWPINKIYLDATCHLSLIYSLVSRLQTTMANSWHTFCGICAHPQLGCCISHWQDPIIGSRSGSFLALLCSVIPYQSASWSLQVQWADLDQAACLQSRI